MIDTTVKERNLGGYVEIPDGQPIVYMTSYCKYYWPKWMFWKPRKYVLIAATKNRIYEVEENTITLKQKFKNKVETFTVSERSE